MSTTALTVSLPLSTLYVSGTVNGVDTVWTNTSGQLWEATADRSEDEIYRVELTIIDDTGIPTESRFTLYYGLHLITNRTLADVETVKELAEAIKTGVATEEQVQAYLAAHQKGAYTCEDLNRVEAAVEYLLRRLDELGHYVPAELKTDWTVKDLPTKADMDRYLGNIALLRSMLPVYPTTPKAPTTKKKLDYLAANDIEKILADLDRQISAINQSWYYAGDVFTGEI